MLTLGKPKLIEPKLDFKNFRTNGVIYTILVQLVNFENRKVKMTHKKVMNKKLIITI
jgi:hypothetical protein